MRFATSHSEREFFEELHDDTRVRVIVLDGMVRSFGWPELVVTDVLRTPEENRRIWLPIAQEWVRKFRAGERLDADGSKHAKTLAALSPSDLEEWARAKFSWHLDHLATAVDLRKVDPETGRRRYGALVTADELRRLCDMHQLCPPGHPTREQAIDAWFEARSKPVAEWEYIRRDHGTGPHWHLARRIRVAGAPLRLA